MPTRRNRWFLLQILLLAQHVSGHHYAHHQELESIIEAVAACRIWCFFFQVVGMMWSWGLCVRFSGLLYNTLELLMMGIVVPETGWASNKICNKNHLLHLVGILFPHVGTIVAVKFCLDPILSVGWFLLSVLHIFILHCCVVRSNSCRIRHMFLKIRSLFLPNDKNHITNN